MVKVCILRTAGTNCDVETAFAFEQEGAVSDLVHINEILSNRRSLNDYQILAIPGGFTYGDDIAAGKLLANEIRYLLWEEIQEFVHRGNLVIGICNGFQVLVKAGILPECDGHQIATLAWNDSGKFEDRWVYLKTAGGNNSPWLRDLPEIIYLPVAHGEGKFVTDEETLEQLDGKNQIAFQYVDKEGNLAGYPFNPNGSLRNIAGITDPSGHILGLMPHPERFIHKTQHPRWTREEIDVPHGKLIFKNAISYFK